MLTQFNRPILSYDEWCAYMTLDITWRGRRFHNAVSYINPDRYCVENWIAGERIFLSREEMADLRFNVPTDPRWIYIGNRNPSDEMLPEYLAIGADKWEWPDMEVMFPNRPPPLEA